MCPDLAKAWLRQIRTPIILTDSKGDYLSRQARNRLDNSIVWLGDKGWTSYQGLRYLTRKCNSLKEEYGNFHLFIWLGTCDTTTKGRKYVYLNEDYSRDAAILI